MFHLNQAKNYKIYPRSVSLRDIDEAFLIKIGSGSLSTGLRIVIDAVRDSGESMKALRGKNKEDVKNNNRRRNSKASDKAKKRLRG